MAPFTELGVHEFGLMLLISCQYLKKQSRHLYALHFLVSGLPCNVISLFSSLPVFCPLHEVSFHF